MVVKRWIVLAASVCLFALVACGSTRGAPTAAPTADPDIFNTVPKTTVFEPGQCMIVLEKPAPAYTSNTLGGQSTGEIPPGEYEVGVAADYGTSLWYALNGVAGANYINSTGVASTKGTCSIEGN